MELVSQNVDLSKKVLEVDINSPIFYSMLHDLNKEIKRVIDKVYDQEFEAGEITLKLSLAIPESYKEIPVEKKASGEIINETYKYRRPYFEPKVTSTLKKQYKQEGFYTDEKEIRFENGQYFIVPIVEPQISLFDDEEDFI